MFQTKVHDKSPERELNEMEIKNLPDKDFKVTIINMLTDMQKNIEDLREDFNKDTEVL